MPRRNLGRPASLMLELYVPAKFAPDFTSKSDFETSLGVPYQPSGSSRGEWWSRGEIVLTSVMIEILQTSSIGFVFN